VSPLPMIPSMSDLSFSPDGRCLACVLEDGTVVVYELATGQPRGTFGKKLPPAPRFPSQYNRFSRCAFSPDNKSLAQSDADGVVRLWDLATGKELAAFKGHAEVVNVLAFSSDGKRLASASDDSTVLIWDVSKIQRPMLAAKALTAAELEAC